MIFDTIENRELYFDTPIFKEIFKKLKTLNANTPNGIYFKEDDYYFKVVGYDTKLQPSIIESHRREIDIQIMLSGKEQIKLYNIKDVNITVPYSAESDCEFYKSDNASNLALNLTPGYMAIFFPQDIHECQYAVNNEVEKIKKIVIKINEKLFTH
ncbi:YhcH/YjgK/YiaL family protein [Aquimarina hainanensis]|uniref:YhcH/YjgK/YiaL family protein n=1 Tax=Aquimarina hainanensis TaxID=1578017 RepID=A0ABW5N5U9_9FLAO